MPSRAERRTYEEDREVIMNRFQIYSGAIFAFIIVGAIACGGGTEIRIGETVSGTITGSDADDEGWKSKTYVIEVSAGTSYIFNLSSSTGDTVGIWNEDKFGYIVEVSPVVTSRSGTHTFSESGFQELFVQSPESDVPSQFTFTITPVR